MFSREDKQRLIQAHLEDQDFVQVATTLGIKRGTARSTIRRHQDAAQGELVFPVSSERWSLNSKDRQRNWRSSGGNC